jgi:hypothetical protein
MATNQELEELLSRPTAPVPEVGRVVFGLSRNTSYQAAQKGDLPTIRIGRTLHVPTAWVRKTLGLED